MNEEPQSSRPFMPGYGILGPAEGGGLLPWSLADERLKSSHDYWLATVRPDGRPHVMPVWGVWSGGALWFSTGGRSRKAANLALDDRCTLTTDDAINPVVIDGTAEVVADSESLESFLEALNAKYSTSYARDLVDPAVNRCFRVRPSWVFSLSGGNFSGSPTRWRPPTA
jgi:PPOX class probable F420-dependent enzyme